MFDIRKIQEEVIYNAVKSESDEETAKEIVYGIDNKTKEESDPVWVNDTMKRLEDRFDKISSKKIRMKCQCGHGMDSKVQLVEDLMAHSSSLEELGNLEKAQESGLFYKDGRLFLQFDMCPCPMLSKVDKLESYTWCECTTGYSKVLFEKAFKCEVDVELLKSIKAGDDICLMTIIPQEEVWK